MRWSMIVHAPLVISVGGEPQITFGSRKLTWVNSDFYFLTKMQEDALFKREGQVGRAALQKTHRMNSAIFNT